jgi:predicted  nucleic acid-binding Zn-ribbon protein
MPDYNIKVMPPLDGIISEINDRLKKLEAFYESYGSRIVQFEKDLAKLDGKIRRIEKYAK